MRPIILLLILVMLLWYAYKSDVYEGYDQPGLSPPLTEESPYYQPFNLPYSPNRVGYLEPPVSSAGKEGRRYKDCYPNSPCIEELKRCNNRREELKTSSRGSKRALELMGIKLNGSLDHQGRKNLILDSTGNPISIGDQLVDEKKCANVECPEKFSREVRCWRC